MNFLLCFVFLGVLLKSEAQISKILGGHNAENAYPYHVSLMYDGGHFCSGTILNEYNILTAGQCIPAHLTAANVSILTGTLQLTKGGVVYQGKEFIKHTSYNRRTLDYDLAIIRVSGAITFNENTKPVTLSWETPFLWTKVKITGWGYTLAEHFSENLQVFQTRIVRSPDCKRCDLDKIFTKNEPLKGLHPGDTGGPVIADGQQVGIVSYNSSSEDMAPYVHVNVAFHLFWILKNSNMDHLMKNPHCP